MQETHPQVSHNAVLPSSLPPDGKGSSRVLLVTATELETKELHSALKRENNADPEKKHTGIQTYYYSKFAGHEIVHVQCKMGAAGPSGSTLTVRDAIEQHKLSYVIMIGIAFGAEKKSQRIGDVLVSESVIPYDSQRVGSKSIRSRGIPSPAGVTLFNRFKNASKWTHKVGRNKSQIILAPMLSGETLIDNRAYRDSILQQHPNAKGGEMEGHGVASAAISKGIEWILVKGICDFADGHKGVNKSKRQKQAVRSAISLCKFALSGNGSLKENNINKKPNYTANPSLVLFEIYNPDCEPFFIERQFDKDLRASLSARSSWIFGESGVGKTTSLRRFANLSKIQLHYIGLAHCATGTADALIKEILYELCAQRNTPIDPGMLDVSADRLSAQLRDFLIAQNNCLVYIDEIPTSAGIESLFLQRMVGVIHSVKMKSPKSSVRFLLSSINQPTLISSTLGVVEILKIEQCPPWSDIELCSLISVIEKYLNVKTDDRQRAKIITAASGKPRYIKLFYANYIAKNNSFDESITTTTAEMQS